MSNNCKQIVRSFSNKALAFQKQRLAGRRRFYRNVQVVKNDVQGESVASPISAGVDGTQSATGVKGYLGKHSLSHLMEDENSYGVALDGKHLKTPLGQKLLVPSKLLATGIAAEWNAQASFVNPTQMPLTALACTALDQTSSQPAMYQQQSLKFLPTDTICYYVDPMQDRQLYQQQQDSWEPIHKKVEEIVGHAPAGAHGTEGYLMRSLPHAPELFDYAKNYVESLDPWNLTILHTAASEAKSFLVAWYLLEEDVDIQEFVKLTRIEEEYQIENWGMVEGQHDYDRLNASIQLNSAHLLKQMLS